MSSTIDTAKGGALLALPNNRSMKRADRRTVVWRAHCKSQVRVGTVVFGETPGETG
jgi:hypothetical protein